MNTLPATEHFLHHQVIVIVGGTAGLGKSAAIACSRAGASLVLIGKEANEAEETANLLGGQAIVLAGDAAEPRTAEAAVAKAVQTFGRLTGLYHVAGGSGRKWGDGPLHELTDEGAKQTVELNLTSVMYSNRAAVRQFLAQGKGGCVLNMASALAHSPSPRFFSTHAYAAAKAGVLGLTKSAAAFYAPHNIRFNAVAPGLVETPMSHRAVANDDIAAFVRTKQPLDGGRIGQPSDLDAAVVYLLSDAAKFVTGQVLNVDGGWSVSEGEYRE